MEFNETELVSNETIAQVINYFNISLTNLTNSSHETQTKLFDLFEAYKTKEREQLIAYKFVAYVVGTLIVLSNLTVVVSSGLILKKGQQPKSTYLLLGNVSLADTIIGISIIFGAIVDNSMSSNPLCIFQIGMLVCPAMVSIFSVGMIAVDRYIYILHGLYYQRWFNTTKVRIGIVCIWGIGVTLSFMPATGWTNQELDFLNCSYIGLFPGSLILLNSLLSIIPIVVVVVLYSIILVRALKNVANIKAKDMSVKNSASNSKPKLRVYRGNDNCKKVTSAPCSIKYKNKNGEMKRSASFDSKLEHHDKLTTKSFKSQKSKSIDDLVKDNSNNSEDFYDTATNNKTQYESKFSVITLDSNSSDLNVSTSDLHESRLPEANKKAKKRHKTKGPNKLRAITVVMLTTGSFIFTWLPFFIVVIFFVFCEEKLTNPKCLKYRVLLRGPLGIIALLNSFLNPLIYAWWHKGFQRTVKMYWQKYVRTHFFNKAQLNPA